MSFTAQAQGAAPRRWLSFTSQAQGSGQSQGLASHPKSAPRPILSFTSQAQGSAPRTRLSFRSLARVLYRSAQMPRLSFTFQGQAQPQAKVELHMSAAGRSPKAKVELHLFGPRLSPRAKVELHISGRGSAPTLSIRRQKPAVSSLCACKRRANESRGAAGPVSRVERVKNEN